MISSPIDNGLELCEDAAPLALLLGKSAASSIPPESTEPSFLAVDDNSAFRKDRVLRSPLLAPAGVEALLRLGACEYNRDRVAACYRLIYFCLSVPLAPSRAIVSPMSAYLMS